MTGWSWNWPNESVLPFCSVFFTEWTKVAVPLAVMKFDEIMFVVDDNFVSHVVHVKCVDPLERTNYKRTGRVYQKWNSILKTWSPRQRQHPSAAAVRWLLSLSFWLYLSKCTTLCHFIWSVRSLSLWTAAQRRETSSRQTNVMWCEVQDSPIFFLFHSSALNLSQFNQFRFTFYWRHL